MGQTGNARMHCDLESCQTTKGVSSGKEDNIEKKVRNILDRFKKKKKK